MRMAELTLDPDRSFVFSNSYSLSRRKRHTSCAIEIVTRPVYSIQLHWREKSVGTASSSILLEFWKWIIPNKKDFYGIDG